MGLRPNETILIALSLIATTVVAILVLKPLVQALARRIEGRAADPALRAEVNHLREQLAEVEPLRGRMLELEERLDFAERLLSQGGQREPSQLPRGPA